MVVVDSSVLIPLSKIGRLELIKRSFDEIITTDRVYNEVIVEGKGRKGTSKIKDCFETWISKREIDSGKAKEMAELEGIAEADASLLLLVEEISSEPILLTNDKALILVARSRNIEYNWLTTLILKSVKEAHIDNEDGEKIIDELIDVGMNLEAKVYSRILKKMDEY